MGSERSARPVIAKGKNASAKWQGIEPQSSVLETDVLPLHHHDLAREAGFEPAYFRCGLGRHSSLAPPLRPLFPNRTGIPRQAVRAGHASPAQWYRVSVG